MCHIFFIVAQQNFSKSKRDRNDFEAEEKLVVYRGRIEPAVPQPTFVKQEPDSERSPEQIIVFGDFDRPLQRFDTVDNLVEAVGGEEPNADSGMETDEQTNPMS